jgi:hypothetical protein
VPAGKQVGERVQVHGQDRVAGDQDPVGAAEERDVTGV